MIRTLSICLLALALPAFAAQELEPSEAQALEKKFLRQQQALRTLQVDFRQTLASRGLRNPVVSEGKVYYKAPDDLCISYSRPEGDYSLLRGQELQVARRGKAPRNVPLEHPSAKPLLALRQMLRGQPSEDQNLFNRTVKREQEQYLVLLEPKTPAPDLPATIENRIDAATHLLTSMRITLPSGTALQFEFSNPQRNRTLDPALFTPKQ